jgi:hypothetical protein
MSDRMGRKETRLVVLAAILLVGLACNTFIPSSGPVEPEGSTRAPVATKTPRILPTPPPTWTPTCTPTSPPVSPTPTVEPTATISLSLGFPTSVVPTLVSPSPPSVGAEFPIPDFGDLDGGWEASCEPGEDVLIEAADDCSPASMTCSATVNVFGMLITAQTFYEIQGMEADRCAVYIRVDQMSVEFGDELVQMMLEGEELTLDDIRQMEEEANEEFAQMRGQDGVCWFDSAAGLAAWLGAMKKGASYGYSGSCRLVDGEWKCGEGEGAPECEGDLFESTFE